MDKRTIGGPPEPDDAGGEQAITPRSGADQGAVVRVLIAHGSSKAREALTRVVSDGVDEYFEVIETEDGGATLDLLLTEDPPQVALVDWDLPGIEGPEMCRLVRDFHHGHDTHLVILASSSHTDTVDAWRAGAADCIATPASAAVLSAAVEKGLRAMGAADAGAERDAGDRDAGAEQDAGPWDAGADVWERGPSGDGPTTLDAVRSTDGDGGSFFELNVVELRATSQPGIGAAPRIERREAEEPRGATLLQAVIGEF